MSSDWRYLMVQNNAFEYGCLFFWRSGATYYAPISSVRIEGDFLKVDAPWCAKLCFMRETFIWRKSKDLSLAVSVHALDRAEIKDDRSLIVEMSKEEKLTLVPWQSFRRVDPAHVEGLRKGVERLLALYPDLRFDLGVADEIFKRFKFEAALRVFIRHKDEMQSIRQILDCISRQASREQFLLRYIEAVTGSHYIIRQVY